LAIFPPIGMKRSGSGKPVSDLFVSLDPTIGHEIRKTRPCVIISPNEMNRHLGTILIAPLTSTQKGEVVLDQIRTIGKTR
jgi:mRNA interferase MazF